MSFATIFTFTRAFEAPYRDTNGTGQTAAIDQPRFDHDLDGTPIGLKIAAGYAPGTAERVSLANAIAIDGAATVFHALRRSDGTIARRALYTLDVNAAINACLRTVGHQVTIGAVAGFVPGRDGIVRYARRDWAMPALIATSTGALLAAGGTALLLAA